MTIYEYVAFSGVFIFIFGYMISIFTLIKRVEEFVRTQPKFVYEVEIDNSQGYKKIISNGLPFPEYHKAKNINENMKEPILSNNYLNNKHFKFGGCNKMRSKEGLLNSMNSKIEKEITKNGIFKTKRALLDFIFEHSDRNPLSSKDIGSIFISLKENNMLKETKMSERFVFDLNNHEFLKMIYSHIYWYEKHSNNIERIGMSTWKYKW